MTLKKIDERLCLYKDYLRYWLDNKSYNKPLILNLGAIPNPTEQEVLELFKQTGLFFINSDEPYVKELGLLTFNQWLYQNGYEDLVLYHPDTIVEKGGKWFRQVEHNGIVYNFIR